MADNGIKPIVQKWKTSHHNYGKHPTIIMYHSPFSPHCWCYVSHHPSPVKRGRKLSSCAIACKDDTIEVLRAAKAKPVMVISPAELTGFFWNWDG